MGDRLRSLPIPDLIKAPVRNALVRYYERRYARGELEVLFLVGHMRSGSTLLLHILNSNPAVSGYGETHREYRSRRDFAWLTLDVCRAFRRLRPRGRYVMDKVLYRNYILNPDLLKERQVKLVFLVRKPEESIPSILRFRPRDIHTEEQALRYFVRQLQMVEDYARAKGDPAGSFFLTYDELVHDAAPVLAGLGAFLGLETPLSQEYRTMWATGERGPRGLGDDSPEIKLGRIVTKRARRPVDLAPATLTAARAAYQRCLSVLPELCHGAAGGPIAVEER
jgi:hypothetical protein